MRSKALAAAAFVAAFSVVLQAPRTATAADYHWAPTGGPPSWPAPGNWSPPRFTPLATDRILFDGGGAYDVISVPNATIGQLVVSNGTTVTLNAGSAGNNLTIAGSTGPDLEIAAGAYMYLGGLNALNLNLGAGATAAISGFFSGVGGPHHLQALDVDAIEFLAGSVGSGSVGFTGNLFGDGTGASSLNSVRFRAGSTYMHVTGANPFGAAQPSTVVTFDPGSLYKLNATINPSLSGRTYANFEYNGPGAITATGSAACSIDSIVVNSGTVSLEPTGVLSLRGSIRVRSSAILNLGPTSGTVNYRLNGSSLQALVDSTGGASTGLVLRPSVKLSLDNPAGFTDLDAKHLVVPGILEFVHGVAHLDVSFGTTGSYLGASQATGWIDGRINPLPLAQALPGLATLPLGTAATYMPIDVIVHGMTHANRLGGLLHDDRSFNPAVYSGSQLDTTKMVHPNWLIALLDSTGWSDFDAVMHFQPAEYSPGANPLAFVARKQSYSLVPPLDLTWRSTTLGARTATTHTVLNVTRQKPTDTNFNFAVGEPSVVYVSVLDSAVVEGNGPMRFRIVLSEPAIDPISFDVHTTSGSATGGVDYVEFSTRISIAPGTTQFIVGVPVTSDSDPEPDETFTFTLSAPDKCVLGDDVATGTILDNDDVDSPVIAVTSPNGGETKLVGENIDLQWTASDAGGVASVDLELTRDDGVNWEPIASGIANTGTYAWIATGPLTQLARLRATATDFHGNASTDESDGAWAIWSADGVEDELPTAFALGFASANPGSGTSHIRYALPRDQDVQMSILDVRGRTVAVLANGPQPAGVHVVSWNPGDAPAGVYFVRFRTQDWKSQLRLVHL